MLTYVSRVKTTSQARRLCSNTDIGTWRDSMTKMVLVRNIEEEIQMKGLFRELSEPTAPEFKHQDTA
jgi:predicted secreted protein